MNVPPEEHYRKIQTNTVITKRLSGSVSLAVPSNSVKEEMKDIEEESSSS